MGKYRKLDMRITVRTYLLEVDNQLNEMIETQVREMKG